MVGLFIIPDILNVKPQGKLIEQEKIMQSTDYSQLARDYEQIEQAIQFLETQRLEQPGLTELAHSLHLSEYHLQRLFSRWVGISPKRFMQYLTKENAKQLLNQSTDLLSTAHMIGLSGPGRLHDMFVSCEAVTPGEYKNQGAGLKVRYGFHPSPFGECLVAVTRRGICRLVFVRDGEREAALSSLISSWPAAEIKADLAGTGFVINEMMALFQRPSPTPTRIYLSGTNFQIKVWEALMQIPAGTVVSYQQVAIQIGMPGGGQAVGNAISNNPIPVLIPCHRVIRKNGEFGNYRWGAMRKKALLGWEMAKVDLAISESEYMVRV
jgi:AraC family transcriptional regulator of adaptative response/methylated-DNA-[protein]-cysteine methyltransferase